MAAAICAVILAAAGAAFTVLSTAGNGKLACIGVEVEGAPTMAWLAWLGAAGFARGGYLARDNTLAPPATASVVLVILIAMALFCSVAAAAASGLAGPAVLAAAAAAGWAAPLLVAHLFRRGRLYTAAGQLLLLEGQAGASTNDMEGFAASTLTGEGLVLAFAASALLFSGMLTYAFRHHNLVLHLELDIQDTVGNRSKGCYPFRRPRPIGRWAFRRASPPQTGPCPTATTPASSAIALQRSYAGVRE